MDETKSALNRLAILKGDELPFPGTAEVEKTAEVKLVNLPSKKIKIRFIESSFDELSKIATANNDEPVAQVLNTHVNFLTDAAQGPFHLIRAYEEKLTKEADGYEARKDKFRVWVKEKVAEAKLSSQTNMARLDGFIDELSKIAEAKDDKRLQIVIRNKDLLKEAFLEGLEGHIEKTAKVGFFKTLANLPGKIGGGIGKGIGYTGAKIQSGAKWTGKQLMKPVHYAAKKGRQLSAYAQKGGWQAAHTGLGMGVAGATGAALAGGALLPAAAIGGGALGLYGLGKGLVAGYKGIKAGFAGAKASAKGRGAFKTFSKGFDSPAAARTAQKLNARGVSAEGQLLREGGKAGPARQITNQQQLNQYMSLQRPAQKAGTLPGGKTVSQLPPSGGTVGSAGAPTATKSVGEMTQAERTTRLAELRKASRMRGAQTAAPKAGESVVGTEAAGVGMGGRIGTGERVAGATGAAKGSVGGISGEQIAAVQGLKPAEQRVLLGRMLGKSGPVSKSHHRALMAGTKPAVPKAAADTARATEQSMPNAPITEKATSWWANLTQGEKNVMMGGAAAGAVGGAILT